MRSQRQPWFRPKLFGIGVGPPVSWQGWVATAFFLVGLTVDVLVLQGGWRFAGVAVISVAFLLVARGRTTAPMRWRWGR